MQQRHRLTNPRLVFSTTQDKVDVNGQNAAPVFAYLKDKQGGFITNAVKWCVLCWRRAR